MSDKQQRVSNDGKFPLQGFEACEPLGYGWQGYHRVLIAWLKEIVNQRAHPFLPDSSSGTDIRIDVENAVKFYSANPIVCGDVELLKEKMYHVVRVNCESDAPKESNLSLMLVVDKQSEEVVLVFRPAPTKYQ